jgi:heme exporter protein C
MNWAWFHRFASPPHVYALAARLTPWFAWPAALCILAGLWGGLVLAPPDYQQGDGFRIIYVHAPSAWMSLMVYVTMAVAAAVGLIWRIKVAHAVAASCAPIGASFTFAALVTGALWGQPMWGTYWEWDPRLTSELVLLFLYLGYMGLRAGIEDTQRGDMVELTPPGTFGDAPGEARHAARHAAAAAADAAGVYAVVHRAAARAAARRGARAGTRGELDT